MSAKIVSMIVYKNSRTLTQLCDNLFEAILAGDGKFNIVEPIGLSLVANATIVPEPGKEPLILV